MNEWINERMNEFDETSIGQELDNCSNLYGIYQRQI